MTLPGFIYRGQKLLVDYRLVWTNCFGLTIMQFCGNLIVYSFKTFLGSVVYQAVNKTFYDYRFCEARAIIPEAIHHFRNIYAALGAEHRYEGEA